MAVLQEIESREYVRLVLGVGDTLGPVDEKEHDGEGDGRLTVGDTVPV